MKLLRWGPPGAEKPGLLDEGGTIRDLSGSIDDFTPDNLSDEAIARLAALDPSSLPAVDAGVRIGACLPRVNHFIAIGLNYSDHAKETGAPIPEEPIVFSKAPSALSGPYDDVRLMTNSVKTDWEVELAFVIGRSAYEVSEADALSLIAGYCICNDVSERAWQAERGGQWIKGKSAPTYGPLGPWLVTRDEVPDPQNLDLTLDVNGERMQTGNTNTMIFPVAELIAYVSQTMMLEAGDVITTGTPPGVGLGMNPQRFLSAGDEMHLTIMGLGEQHQKVVQ